MIPKALKNIHTLLMNLLPIKAILFLVAATPCLAFAQQLPPCVELAANEHNVPVNVFKAIVLVTQSQQASKNANQIEVGALGMHHKAAEIAAKGLNTNVQKIHSDKCTSYRAAAWWLANVSGLTKDADWVAVNRYFHGRTSRPGSIMTDRVKMVYDQLD